MGIDLAAFDFLLRIVPALERKDRMVMLGRQSLHVAIPRLRNRADRLLDAYCPGLTLEALENANGGYAEPFFQRLGFDQVDSLDYSDFEGATLVHDLNTPLPKKLHRKYDLVFDGGTLEHVFDVKTALTNAYDLLAPGGSFIGISPGNNFFAHGFYQFSPDLVFSFWKRGMGCEVPECWVLPERPRDKPWQIFDPHETGHRVRVAGKMPAQRTYLAYVVHRPKRAKARSGVQQSDYTHRWAEDG
ncbi:class I SAM-dependent methyltransferase [Rhodovulum adriaticum]|uniref:Methyltransferase family protein n=1 Tax=Rhodovulum adriaticum TaxID=35804 RepID=A0A4R2NWH4_RHOAD|nr:class I SAM-dependent methyltransferase [Rhodovulum adriaticum]MBK1636331.1 hypothetical protein [Rhodovulum adriaticum]TCP26332.1 hypothetical protein EV656_102297 [Rhodovulum adriaticum]